MNKTQAILAGAALAVLAMFGETLILKGQYPLAMEIGTGVIGALNIAGGVANVAAMLNQGKKAGAE